MENNKEQNYTDIISIVFAVMICLVFLTLSIISIILAFKELKTLEDISKLGVETDNSVLICMIIFFFFTGAINLFFALFLPLYFTQINWIKNRVISYGKQNGKSITDKKTTIILENLINLKEQGILSEEEFNEKKEKLLKDL